MNTSFLSLVEPTSILILAFTLFAFTWGGLYAGNPGVHRLKRAEIAWGALWIALGSWGGEVTCIRLYGFYQYDAPWAFFLDVMPALVVAIWPVVVLSAREVAWSLGWRNEAGHPHPVAVFALVVLDATLVESVAVTSRLWSWNEPGFFRVPWIGVLGWGFYAASVSWAWDRARKRGMRGGLWGLWVPGVAILLTHAALLLTWWGALRWIPALRFEVPSAWLVAGAWGGSLVLTGWIWKRRVRANLRVMGPRIAAALLFLSLVWLQREAAPGLFAFALAFPWPYLAATGGTLRELENPRTEETDSGSNGKD